MAKKSKPLKQKTLPSANPWDPLPISSEGDAEADPIYHAVGMALSTWEGVEIYLSTALLEMLGHFAALRVYGSIIGSARFDVLRAASEAHFGPTSENHAAFAKLIDGASRLSGRRAELAHGRAIRIHNPRIPATGFYLVPSMNSEKTPLKTMLPKYAYTSANIHELRRRFEAFGVNLSREASALLRDQRLLPVDQQE